MFTIIGLLIVFGSVLGGFALESGPFHTLVQPAELLVIGGAAVGTIVVAAPGRLLGSVFRTFLRAFSPKVPTKADYLELLKLQYEVFVFVRKNGAVALDEHLADIGKSSIFSKYPSFLARHHAVEFFRDALKQIVNGTASAEELEVLLDSELDTHHEETAIPVGVLKSAGDSLPGLGIVAAALIGTFLGILLCYGLIQPLSSNVELQEAANGKYLRCIKEGVIASLRGAAPSVAVEFARKAIFSDDRPSSDETEAACRALKQQAS